MGRWGDCGLRSRGGYIYSRHHNMRTKTGNHFWFLSTDLVWPCCQAPSNPRHTFPFGSRLPTKAVRDPTSLAVAACCLGHPMRIQSDGVPTSHVPVRLHLQYHPASCCVLTRGVTLPCRCCPTAAHTVLCALALPSARTHGPAPASAFSLLLLSIPSSGALHQQRLRPRADLGRRRGVLEWCVCLRFICHAQPDRQPYLASH